MAMPELKAAPDAKLAEVKKLVHDAAHAAPAAVQRTTEGMFKAVEDVADFGRGNVEAMARATQLYVSGVQDLSRQSMALLQSLAEQAMENTRAIATAKSLKEAADLQASFARTAFERTAAEQARLQEAALRVAEQATAPITARMSAAFERFGRPTATV